MAALIDRHAALRHAEVGGVQHPLGVGHVALPQHLAHEPHGLPAFLPARDAGVEEGGPFALEQGARPGRRGLREVGGGLGHGGRGTEGFVGPARGAVGGDIVLGGVLGLVDGGLRGVRLLALDGSGGGGGGGAVIRTGLLGLAAAHLASCLSAGRKDLCSLEDRLLRVEGMDEGRKRNEGDGFACGWNFRSNFKPGLLVEMGYL